MGVIRCTARYLLIIEKDAIFQALTQDKLFEQLPCVLVTAKGMPDVATRAFCSHIMSAFPSMTVSLKQSTDSLECTAILLIMRLMLTLCPISRH